MKNASAAARSLARKGVVALKPELSPHHGGLTPRLPHALNPRAAGGVRRDPRGDRSATSSSTFLLHGVTGSGKTEVYLNAIEATLAAGPQRAAAGARDRADARRWPASSSRASATAWPSCTRAFTDVERSEQWRRIRSGAARVVVGTRSGVFAPVRESGPDRGGRGARRQLQAGGDAALQRPRRGDRARAGGRRVRGARARPRRAWRAATTPSAASTRCSNCRSASKRAPCPRWS